MGTILLMGAGLQTTVTGPTYDPDAQLFFNAESAAGVTLTTTEKNAVNQLVLDLKSYGIWTKMKAIYPLVGGTATAHKWNLKDPQDTNAAFRLSFNGGLTHSSNGILGNGSNGYANTFLNPTTNLTANSEHISANIYTTTSDGNIRPHMSTNTDSSLQLGSMSTTVERATVASSFQNKIVTSSTHNGFWCVSRTSSGTSGCSYLYNNGSFGKFTSSGGITNTTISLLRGSTAYSNMGYSFFTIGDGLTDTDMTNLKTAVNNFQTTLGRI